jgi:chemotaxis protein methyltransferase CheR
MIYFDQKTRERVVNKLHRCLLDGGFLMIGHAESLTGIQHSLRYIQPGVYQRQASSDRS